MNKLKYLLCIGLVGCMLTACDDDDEANNARYGEQMLYRSCSIEEGSTLRARTVSTITLDYNNLVALNSAVAITLNGQAMSATVNPEDGRQVVVNVQLANATAYTLSVPQGAVCKRDNEAIVADAFTVNFSTMAGVDASAVAPTLVNANAIAEAQKVYSFMLDNYGEYQLSGAMGAVAWATDYADLVAATAGHYPAIVGFDYIHLASSPSNWIDYGDITPVRETWEAGSIPAMSWHWNVPVSDGSSEPSFRVDGNGFSPSNALIDGTWENNVWKADVAKLAGYLQLLEDAGIPLLWRPFHEAAGDYTWGAWFWWGTEGVDVTAQLYRKLYDELTNTYGIDNLIWVWTMQTSDAGQLATTAQLQAAYPGDNYVDIVGTDIYADQALSVHNDQFELINAAVASRKMVALCECGRLLDVDAAYNEGALWAYFMRWYDCNDAGEFGFYNYPDAESLPTVFGNAHVLNRGDFSLK